MPAEDRVRLEQLCRYLLRPPVAQDRLRLSSDGRVLLELKSPWADGTSPKVVERIARARDGQVKIEPGYDGEYGKIKIFEQSELKPAAPEQAALF